MGTSVQWWRASEVWQKLFVVSVTKRTSVETCRVPMVVLEAQQIPFPEVLIIVILTGSKRQSIKELI
jgi:hypothetical protein